MAARATEEPSPSSASETPVPKPEKNYLTWGQIVKSLAAGGIAGAV